MCAEIDGTDACAIEEDRAQGAPEWESELLKLAFLRWSLLSLELKVTAAMPSLRTPDVCLHCWTCVISLAD